MEAMHPIDLLLDDLRPQQMRLLPSMLPPSGQIVARLLVFTPSGMAQAKLGVTRSCAGIELVKLDGAPPGAFDDHIGSNFQFEAVGMCPCRCGLNPKAHWRKRLLLLLAPPDLLLDDLRAVEDQMYRDMSHRPHLFCDA